MRNTWSPRRTTRTSSPLLEMTVTSTELLRYPAAFADDATAGESAARSSPSPRPTGISSDVVQQHLPYANAMAPGTQISNFPTSRAGATRHGRERRLLPLASRPPWPQTPNPSRTRGRPPSPQGRADPTTDMARIQCRTRTVDVNRSSHVRQRWRVRRGLGVVLLVDRCGEKLTASRSGNFAT